MRLSLKLSTTILILSLFAVSPLSIKAWAQAAPSNTAYSPEQAQISPAGKFIQDLGNNVINIVADKNVSQDLRRSKYTELLRADFDIPAIGHFVLGHAWNTASPQEQTEFLDAFQALIIKTYDDSLSLYAGEKFLVKSVRQEDDNVIVTTEVSHPQGMPPTSIEWVLRQVGNNFSIIDVIIEGVSQSATESQEYTSILERNNGNMEILIKTMREQAEKSQPLS